MRFRSLLPAALIAFAGAFAPASIAQDKPAAPETPAVQDQPAAQEKPIGQEKPAAQDKPAAQVQQIDPQVKQAARALIEELLKVSHAEEISGDLRRTLREVYIPGIRDFVMGNTPGVAAPDPKSAAAAAKLLTFMDYARRGGDELDVALAENREAMISDVAEQIAKSATSTDIYDIRATLKLPAVTKGLDTLYAVSKLLTGFTYEDSRTFSSFSAWASRQNLDAAKSLPGLLQLTPGTPPQGGDAVPSKQKVTKAQALVSDLLEVSHLDEMVEDAHRFARDVYAETAPMSESERETLREQLGQYEFLYNLQKAMVLALAPSVIAASLSDEQLSVVQGFVRSPAFAKLSNLLRGAVKAGTAFTKADILEAKKSFEDLESKAKGQVRDPAEERKIEAEWDALAGKWTEILKKRISPDVRDGLDKSLKALEDLKDEGAPI
jgi:hypothetical protein